MSTPVNAIKINDELYARHDDRGYAELILHMPEQFAVDIVTYVTKKEALRIAMVASGTDIRDCLREGDPYIQEDRV